jgi:hypothetical protein
MTTELVMVASLPCDLNQVPFEEFDRCENAKTRRPYFAANMTCRFILLSSSLIAEVYCNEINLCSKKVVDFDLGSSRH